MMFSLVIPLTSLDPTQNRALKVLAWWLIANLVLVFSLAVFDALEQRLQVRHELKAMPIEEIKLRCEKRGERLDDFYF